VLIRAPMKQIRATLQALAQMPAPKTQFSEAMGEMMARPVFEIAAFEVVGAPRRMAIPDRLPIPSR
jgi:hypothetical protein